MSPAVQAAMLGVVLGGATVEAHAQATRLVFTPGAGTTPLVQSARDDVKPGETFTTGPSEVRELLLSDGTALTLAQGSEVMIEAYDPAIGGSGLFALRLTKGLIRVSGGTLNNSTQFVIRTPVSEIALDAGTAVIEANGDGRTRASLLFGRELRMTSGGQTQSVQRAGFEVVSVGRDGPPSAPARQGEQSAASDACRLWSAKFHALTPTCEQGTGPIGSPGPSRSGTRVAALATEQPIIATNQNTGPPGFQEIGSVDGWPGAGGFTAGSLIGPRHANQDLATVSDVLRSRTATQNRDR
jgi:hypothetical protein